MALLADVDEQAPITLLLVRTGGADLGELEVRLSAIAARYGELVSLEVVSPDELPAPLAERPMVAPTVLVLRRGELVGEAMGAFLPARELARVVRCAVEWPDAIS